MRMLVVTICLATLVPSAVFAQPPASETPVRSPLVLPDFDSSPAFNSQSPSRAHAATKGALIGLAIGTGWGTYVGLRTCGGDNGCTFAPQFPVYFGLLGAAIGATIGGSLHRERTVAASPIVSRRTQAVAVGVRF